METTPQPRTFLGTTLGEWGKIFIGGMCCSIVVGIILAWWNAKVPHLTVVAPNAIPFRGDKHQIGIPSVIITNDGSKEAEDVDCSLLLKGSKIQEVKASPDNLNPAVSFDQDKASVKIKLLNVGEFLFVSALVNNPDSLPSDLSPQVRGKGVVGEKAARRMSLADIAVDIDIVFCVISVPFLITAYFIIRKTLERNDARMERSKKDFENAVAVLNEQTAKAKRVLEPIDKLFDCARQLKAHLLDLQGKVPDNLKEELGELVSNLDRIIPVEDGLQSAG